MCYARPGPRCSAYAYSALRERKSQLDSAKARVADVESRMNRLDQMRKIMGDTPPDVILEREHRDALNAELRAKVDYYAALDVYDETPHGQSYLKQMQQEYEVQGETERAAGFQQRLESAQTRRADKINLYKHVKQLTDVDENMDSHEDAIPMLHQRMGGEVTSEAVRNSISTRGHAPVYYTGSMRELHGKAEVLEIAGNRFTIRLEDGSVLERVRGSSLVMA